MIPLYVGIDVSSKNNVAYFMLPNGDKHSNFPIINSHDGSIQLVKRIFSALTTHSLDTVLIGLEATSVYGDNLVYFLREDAILASFNRKIHVLNPKQVKKFKDAYNDLPKNDYVDAFVIADCLRFGRINKEVYMGDYRYKALQNLTRARYFTVCNLVKEKQRFMNVLFKKYSTFTQERVFSDTSVLLPWLSTRNSNLQKLWQAWTQYQSGSFEAENTRLIKSGNRFLKYYLCEAAFSLVRCDKEYSRFYHLKYKEVNRYQHKRALALTAHKFVRLVFALLKDNRYIVRQNKVTLF